MNTQNNSAQNNWSIDHYHESMMKKLVDGYVWYKANGCDQLADRVLSRIEHHLNK